MACVIKKNKSPYWYVKYYENSVAVEYSTKSRNRLVAKRIRNDIEDRVALQKFNLIPHNKKLLVVDFYKEFLDTKISSGKTCDGTLDRYQRALKYFFAYLPEKKYINDFTNRDINDFVITRSKEVGQSAVYNELRTLKTFFNLCERLHNYPAPTKNISVKRPDRKEPCLYSQEEIRMMVKVSDVFKKAVLMTDLQGGLRKREMATRKWKHVDFENERVYITLDNDFKTKGRDNRFVPLRQETAEALLRWREQTSFKGEQNYLFPGRHGKRHSHFDLVMKRILKDIGVKGHCQKFRDNFASYSLACGVPLQNVRDYLGHDEIGTTNHYANYMPKRIEPDIKQLFEWK